jgi:hypothetical protein
MSRKEKILKDQNEFLEGFIKSLEDIKAGRVKDFSELKLK